MSNKAVLPKLKVGDVITARLLNEISTAVNANTAAVRAPAQIIEEDPGTEEAVIGDEVFQSTSGTETTVTITDSNGDTSEIERVDTIVFTETTSGRTMSLSITYPL